jgi:hypothetical protein
MNRLTYMRLRPSTVDPMARWVSGFSIVARLRRELLKEFVRSVWSASRDGNAVEPPVRNPQSNLPLSHPAFCPPSLPGSHAADLVPPGSAATSSPRLVGAALQRLGEPHKRPDLTLPSAPLLSNVAKEARVLGTRAAKVMR